MERKLRHPFFVYPTEQPLYESEWFQGLRASIGSIASFADIRVTRGIAISMLAEAWDEREFHENNPKTTPLDRMQAIAFLQHLFSATGILSYNEIKSIQQGFPPAHIDKVLHSFDLAARLVQKVKSSGKKIGLFHGSFDPFTASHSTLNSIAQDYCDFLVVGFDSDDLIRQRKGELRAALGQDAPRFTANQRRSFAAGLTTVDMTVEMRPNEIDQGLYEQDYRDLGVDVLFIGESNHPAYPRMKASMDKLGGEVIVVNPNWNGVHSTEVMEFIMHNPSFGNTLPAYEQEG